jgi:hypothetical protein
MTDTCDMHHELDGWLPLMPPIEAFDNGRDAMEEDGVTIPMLFTAELVACPCSPEYSLN